MRKKITSLRGGSISISYMGVNEKIGCLIRKYRKDVHVSVMFLFFFYFFKFTDILF